LRDLRTSNDRSKEAHAKKLTIDPMEISAYEIGAKRIHAEQLPTIAKFGGETSSVILAEDEMSQLDLTKGPLMGPPRLRSRFGGGCTFIDEGIVTSTAFTSYYRVCGGTGFDKSNVSKPVLDGEIAFTC
jgi:hypothetical protein